MRLCSAVVVPRHHFDTFVIVLQQSFSVTSRDACVHSRSYYRGRRGHCLVWFSQNHGYYPTPHPPHPLQKKEPVGVILVSFYHFASSDFNVWLRSWCHDTNCDSMRFSITNLFCYYIYWEIHLSLLGNCNVILRSNLDK